MKMNRLKLRIKEVWICSFCSWLVGLILDWIRMVGDLYVLVVNIIFLFVCILNEIFLCINFIFCVFLLEIKICKIWVKFDIGFILYMYIVISKILIIS